MGKKANSTQKKPAAKANSTQKKPTAPPPAAKARNVQKKPAASSSAAKKSQKPVTHPLTPSEFRDSSQRTQIDDLRWHVENVYEMFRMQDSYNEQMAEMANFGASRVTRTPTEPSVVVVPPAPSTASEAIAHPDPES